MVKENNPVTPDFYNNVINNLQFHQLVCPCGHSGCLSVHGYYRRYVKAPEGKLCFRICRVICECCHHTHALLLSSIVPYSQVSLGDQADIISSYEEDRPQSQIMENNNSIDESSIRHVIRQYLKHWKQKLISENIPLAPVHTLIRQCFLMFSRQFMQIRSTPNILSCKYHTA